MHLFKRVILLMLLLMLSFSMRGEVMSYVNSLYCNLVGETSDSSSDSGETYQSWLHNHSCSFNQSKHLSYSDNAISVKSISELNSSNGSRFRRVVEFNDSFKDSIRRLSLLRGSLLLFDQTKSYRSCKDNHFFITSSDYYVFTLRHILI